MAMSDHLVLALSLLPTAPILTAAAQGAPQVQTPGPISGGETWRVHSFLGDASLEQKEAICLDFEADGTLWVAGSDGLRRYDGYHWEQFDSSDGLPSDYVRSVCVLEDGTLWVGTDKGAGTFSEEDGFDFAGTQDRLAGPCVRRIVQDPLDGSLWFACDQWPNPTANCGITRMQDGVFRTWTSDDGLPSSYVQSYFRASDGDRFALTDHGLAQLVDDRWIDPLGELPGAREGFWSMVQTREGDLLASSLRHIFVRHDGEWRAEPNNVPFTTGVRLTSTRSGEVLTSIPGTSSEVMRYRVGGFEPITEESGEVTGELEYIAEAPDGSIWMAGSNRLTRWERGGEWESRPDLPALYSRDADGGVWFADDTRAVRIGPDGSREFDAHAPVLFSPGGDVWMRRGSALVRWRQASTSSKEILQSHTRQESGIEQIRAAVVDGVGTLWVAGSDQSGVDLLSRFDGSRWTPQPMTAMGAVEDLGRMSEDPDGGVWLIFEVPGLFKFRLLHVDSRGTQREVPLPERQSHAHMPSILARPGGELWCFGFFGLNRLGPGEQEWSDVPLQGLHVESLRMLGEDLWLTTRATTGGRSQIAHLHEGQWRTFQSAAWSAIGDDGHSEEYFRQSDKVVVAGEPDIVDTRSITLPTHHSPTRVVPGWDADFWVGTTYGVLHYQPDGIPPETISLPENGEVVHGTSVELRVRGVGFNRPTSDGRTWQIAISVDGEPWGPFAPLLGGGVSIFNMSPGTHEIAVRVMDEGGDVDPEPSRTTLRVRRLPIQERVWFLPLVAALAAGMLFLAILSLAGWRKVKVQAAGLELEVERRNLELLERQAQVDLAIAGSRGGSWSVHIDPGDPQHPPLSSHYSESSWELLGLDPETLPGTPEDWLNRVLPEDSAAITAAMHRLFAGETDSYEVEYRARHADGGVRWLLSRGRIERDEQGRPMMLVGVHWDVTERRHADEALRESEERFRLLAEHVPGVIYLSLNDERWTMIYLNDEIEPLTGHSKGDFLEGTVSLAELCHPDDLPGVRKQVSDAVAERRSFHTTYRLKHSSGEWRWVEEFGVGVFKDEELRHVEGVLFDVSARVMEEERRELMMRELDHRVKNMLATVIAVADRTLAGSDDLPEFAAAFRGRIASLAQVHEALAHSKWEGASLRDLVQRALAPYRGAGSDRITIEGRDLTLTIHAAPPLAMALHELATNAVKYGSLSVPTGRLDIVFEVTPSADRHRVRLCWMESGGPEVVPPKERGFGLTLIEQGVEYQLGGQVKLDLRPEGLCCEIIFTA